MSAYGYSLARGVPMTRWIYVGLVAAGSACGFSGDGPPAVVDGPEIDSMGNPDGRIDAMIGDPCMDWTDPAEFDVCGAGIPAPGPAEINLPSGDWTLDGNTGVLSGPGGPINLPHVDTSGAVQVSVISVSQVVIAGGATLTIEGTLPVVIASWTNISVDGLIDAGSHYPPGGPGPGAGSPDCPGGGNAPQSGATSADGNGGGGGGGFGGDGGPGGTGELAAAAGGAGGRSRSLPSRVEAGCNGAPGPNGDGGIAGEGGRGGGGLMLLAQGTLPVQGTITAGGGGGGGGRDGFQNGGGGGGSGGMIKLEATTLMVTSAAVIAANGGQGGGGNDNNDALPGQDGQAAVAAALADNNEGMGGWGGPGGFLTTPAGGTGLKANGDPGDAVNGGGGGGGGAGFIAYRGHTTENVDGAATFSPAPMPY